MHINTEEIKNMANERSFNKTKASLPRICPKLTGPLTEGGVLGNVKEYTPIVAAVMVDT